MNILRAIFALAFTTILAACGGQHAVDAPVTTAAAATGVSASASATQLAATPATATATAPARAAMHVASSTMPEPDCAAEGCAGLRIIDGNAEAWRIDAQRRAALEASLPQS